MNTPETSNARVRPVLSAASLSDLLSRMQSGDELSAEAAWGEVYRRYHEKVWARVHYVLRTIPWLREPTEVAADVTGQVFLSLPGAVARYREEGKPEQWLLRVALRTALRHREALTGNWSQRGGKDAKKPGRAAGRTYLDFDDAAVVIAAVFDEAGKDERLDLERVLESWARDPARSRWLPFIQLFREGYSHIEIAERLGITPGTARTWLWKIRQDLAESIGGREVSGHTIRALHIDDAALQDYADGMLASDQDREVESHLAICARCMDAVINARVGLALLVRMQPAPEGLLEVIRARLRAGERPVSDFAAAEDAGSALEYDEVVGRGLAEDAHAWADSPQARDALARLLSPERPRLTELAAIWRAHDAAAWRQTPQLYNLLGRAFLGTGDAILAHEVLAEARAELPHDPYVEHLYGLALARSGSTEMAAKHARALKDEVSNDPVLFADVMGLLARTEKDLAMRSVGRQRECHLRRSQVIYRSAFRKTGQSYPAINAATLALLRHDDAQAQSLAFEARNAALREIDARGNASHWELATLGESALVLDQRAEAETYYRDAVAIAGGQISDIASMRRQARLILHHRGADATWLDAVFAVPRVTVFAGGRTEGAEHEAAAREAIDRHIADARTGFGYSSAAAGYDIVFLETLQARGGQTTIVLPYARDAFVAKEVDIDGRGSWLGRFEHVCDASVEVIESSQASSTSGTMEEYGHQLLIGLGGMQAQLLDVELDIVMAGAAATPALAKIRTEWESMGHEVTMIDA